MAKYKPFVLPFVVALIVLGIIAWVAGWAAHAVFDRVSLLPAPSPTIMDIAVPTVTPAVIVIQSETDPTSTSPTAASSISTPMDHQNPTSTPQPTSTHPPEFTPTPYRVQAVQGDTVLTICRTHCPNLSHNNPDLMACVRRVAEINHLTGPRNNPQIDIGQQLQMPPECFPR